MLTGLKKTNLIKFFGKSLKLSINAQTEERKWELDTWEKFIEKAVKAETKAAL